VRRLLGQDVETVIAQSIVWSHEEFGHKFHVERLTTPDAKGRGFRLYDNGHPAAGGQWHHTLESAVARAEYVTKCEYGDRIRYLEERVQILEARAWEASKILDDALGHVGFLGHLLYEDLDDTVEYDRRALMREIRTHDAVQKKIKEFLKKMFTPPLTFGKTSCVDTPGPKRPM